jgi:hypothetical protein
MAGQPIGRSKAETLNELTPDVLPDRIDGLQTQVATAETEAETARTAAREAAQAAEALRKTGGVKGMTTPLANLVGDMSAYSLRIRAVVVE